MPSGLFTESLLVRLTDENREIGHDSIAVQLLFLGDIAVIKTAYILGPKFPIWTSHEIDSKLKPAVPNISDENQRLLRTFSS